MKGYYSVGRNNSWNTEPVTIKDIEPKGFTVQDSRLSGDKDIFLDGDHAGWLFENQDDQKEFLKEKGLI
jgi:hypothetical protein